MKRNNPFKNLKLDAQEREIERGIEAGEWEVVAASEKRNCPLPRLRQIYPRENEEYQHPARRGTVHALKTKAIAEGMPYQILAASVLHNYAMNA
ncbi:MAG: hypothetical protein Q8L37_05365 [Candidatus Gottesmanbacteria bacterium]|nr:hypothetical protein [Candidatus Gottesmanbacteria bacterium]